MKKEVLFVLAVIISVALSSCSSNSPKEISPTSTEFTTGGLAKLIEVVDEPCQLSYAEQEGTIGTQYIKLKVKLRLTKETPELQNIDARDIDFVGLLSVATINLVDENETKVQSLDVKSEDGLKLKKLLQGKKGDEVTIVFQGEFHNSKDAPKWFAQSAAFTPYLTADIQTDYVNTFSTVMAGSESVHQAAIINDPDGYTNVRAAADGKAEIVAKIVDGERFFFDELQGSKWVKVYRTADADAECIGYMHSSRVMPVGGGIAAMTDDDEEVDLEIEKMIDRFASFVSQLEKVETIDEVYLKRLEKEYKDINKSAEGISFHDLPATQQKRVRELRDKMEEEVERIKKLRYGF